MRALVGQNKRFLVSKKKNRDRTKRSRRSKIEVFLDNADAVIDGCPILAVFARVGIFFFIRRNEIQRCDYMWSFMLNTVCGLL